MVRGIAIMGLNGCGKSTLAHAITKRLDFYEMDVEDYYFPEQKNSRQAVLEQQYDVKCEYKGELPYSMPRSAKEVQEMIRNDIEKHPQFVISGVTMNWDEDILSVIDVAFILEVQHKTEILLFLIFIWYCYLKCFTQQHHIMHIIFIVFISQMKHYLTQWFNTRNSYISNFSNTGKSFLMEIYLPHKQFRHL